MTKVWIYTVASSSHPNGVTCWVPWRIDEDLIFFGPCKCRIRERLRREYLNPHCSYNEVKTGDDLFIVGINGSNKDRKRRIIWVGKLFAVMTFAEAEKRLKGERFRELRNPHSPLHVHPKKNGDELIGYDHVTDYHIKGDEWVADLVSPSARRNTHQQRGSLTLKQGQTAWEVFDRDCCMLLENRFFAQGQGVDFDGEALKILKEAQPERSGIDDYAVFGLTKSKQVDGRKGNYLAIDGELANRFVKWLDDRCTRVARHPQCGGTITAKKSCTQPRRRSVCCT